MEVKLSKSKHVWKMSFILPLNLIDGLTQYRMLCSKSFFLLNFEGIVSLFSCTYNNYKILSVKKSPSIAGKLFPLILDLAFRFSVLKCDESCGGLSVFISFWKFSLIISVVNSFLAYFWFPFCNFYWIYMWLSWINSIFSLFPFLLRHFPRLLRYNWWIKIVYV